MAQPPDEWPSFERQSPHPWGEWLDGRTRTLNAGSESEAVVLHFAAVRDGLQPIGPEVPRLLRQLAAEIEMRNGFRRAQDATASVAAAEGQPLTKARAGVRPAAGRRRRARFRSWCLRARIPLNHADSLRLS
jgi:hypothetical protein